MLTISELVNVSFDTTYERINTNTIDPKNTSAPAVEDALVELTQTAGFFMVTLVEQLDAFSDGLGYELSYRTVNEVRTYHIHQVLTKFQVLEVVNKISSQRSP